jgi:outer membrane protein assembly factor BamB
VLKKAQMPPPGNPQPPQDQVEAMVALLETELAKFKEVKMELVEPPTREWLTWQGDTERTGWARAETTLTRANVANLALRWKSQLDAVPTAVNAYSTLTDPLIVENVTTSQGPKKLVLVASAENNVYALDADTGATVWARKFPNTIKPVQPANGACPNNLNATPVIDKQSGILYVPMNDGKLRGLGLADGDDRIAPAEFVTPYSRNWSLNLVDGVIYTSSSRGCGGAISGIFAIDVRSPNHPVSRFFTSAGKAAGPWGRGGIVHSPFGVIAQTADGPYDPASGRFGDSILSLARDLRLMDSFTPANEDELDRKDFDLGAASPTVFPFQKWTLIAAASKEGVVYLLDAKSPGGPDHRIPIYTSPRYGNDSRTFGFNGVWGSVSTFEDAQGQRFLLVPMEGPPAKDTASVFNPDHGKVVNGSIMAFHVKVEQGKPVLAPAWISHDLDLPGMPVYAQGVVYVLGTGDRAKGSGGGPGRGAFLSGATLGSTPGAPGRGPGAPGAGRGAGGRGGGGNISVANLEEPGIERDAAWVSLQYGPDGQQNGRRYSGGIDLMHAVIYALDAETGEEIYSSKELIDSWNHYGGLALSDGRLYTSTYDTRVFAFGLPGK